MDPEKFFPEKCCLPKPIKFCFPEKIRCVCCEPHIVWKCREKEFCPKFPEFCEDFENCHRPCKCFDDDCRKDHDDCRRCCHKEHRKCFCDDGFDDM